MVCSFSIFLFMSPTTSRYKKLGLELVEPLQVQPHKPRRPPMVEENKDEGARDPFKILLEEALKKKMNAMMDYFSQISVATHRWRIFIQQPLWSYHSI